MTTVEVASVASGAVLDTWTLVDGKIRAGSREDVLDGLRRRVSDDAKLWRVLIEGGWSNGYIRVGVPEAADETSAAEARNDLKHYWLRGEGAAKWATWTELFDHLRKHMPAEMAKRVAAEWFHERYRIWPGHTRGDNPRGPG